jgi:FkbM family methyltransferase
MPRNVPRQSGRISRSLDVYYRDAARTQRMDRLHAELLPAGGLVFDIGAHVGDRTASFARLGATVVALEPQPRVFRALRLIHGRTSGITVICAAAGAVPARMTMYLNTENPTISTASADFIAATRQAEGWQGQVWDREISVPVTTLDQLITDHGMPDFVKIDVEGHEAEVLAGLSVALPLLSFEFTTIQRSVAYACMDRLETLGAFEYNLSLGEEHLLHHADWISAADLRARIMDLPEAANSGDVYARLISDQSRHLVDRIKGEAIRL